MSRLAAVTDRIASIARWNSLPNILDELSGVEDRRCWSRERERKADL